jgi:hypothetical protein
VFQVKFLMLDYDSVIGCFVLRSSISLWILLIHRLFKDAVLTADFIQSRMIKNIS